MSGREEFESWCVARWGGDRDGFARDPAGKYVLSTLEFAWAAWCARDARIAELERAKAELERNITRGDSRRHFICICPDCANPLPEAPKP